MEAKITKHPEYVEISISSVGDNKTRILASFGLCQVGKCNCPTNEYQNLDHMEIEENGDDLTLKLYPMQDKELDLAEIGKCLEFTIGGTTS